MQLVEDTSLKLVEEVTTYKLIPENLVAATADTVSESLINYLTGDNTNPEQITVPQVDTNIEIVEQLAGDENDSNVYPIEANVIQIEKSGYK